MSLKPPVSVGIIGCGHAAEMHVAAIRSLPHARVVAAADIDESAVRRIAGSGEIRVFSDYRELLGTPGMIAVAVLTPPAVQYEIALAALAAGKHVLVERPMACSLAEADRLIEHTVGMRTNLMPGYHLRFHRHVQAARRVIETGALGQIRFLQSVVSTTNDLGRRFPAYRKKRSLGGGVLIDLAVAHFDLWRYLLGEEVEEVLAMSCGRTSDDTTASVMGRMPSGTIATSVFSGEAAEEHRIAVHGASARLEMSLYRADGFALAGSGTFPGDAGRRIAGLRDSVKGIAGTVRARRAGGVYLESYRLQWQHFTDAILDGSVSSPTVHDGRRALAIVLAAIESADAGRAVRLAG